MEYEANLISPQLWFCGRAFLKKANELRDQLGGIKSPCPADFATCEEAKHNILSGIRVALGLPANCENLNIPFYQELRRRMDDGRLPSLMDRLIATA